MDLGLLALSTMIFPDPGVQRIFPYSDTSRTYAPNTRIYGYIKGRFPSSPVTAKPRFYVGKFGQCTEVTL